MPADFSCLVPSDDVEEPDVQVFSRLTARNVRLATPPVAVHAQTWDQWVREIFPSKVYYDFSRDQRRIWDWAASITRDYTPPPAVGILPRGGGKTTTIDLISGFILGRKMRDFILIVASTLGKSEGRVKSIRSLLESAAFRRRYPDVGEPAITRLGHTKAWRATKLLTESGQVVAAASFESDNRGFLEDSELRPDLIIFDDLDKMHDSAYLTRKKEMQILQDILPTEGSRPAATIFIQNLIKAEGIADRQVKGEADFWTDRILIGPTKAIDGLEIEFRDQEYTLDDGTTAIRKRPVIVGGTATWEGQDLEACQSKIDRWGLSTFLYEQQHEVTDLEGALLKERHFITAPMPDLKDLVDVVVGVDPSGGRTECGIIACAALRNGTICTLADRTQYMGDAGEWAKVAVLTAWQMKADIVIETTYGGKTVTDALLVAARELQDLGMVEGPPAIYTVAPHYSKKARAWAPAQMHIQGLVFYVEGEDFTKLRAEWTTWVQGVSKESPNRMDAAVHAMNHLMTQKNKRRPPCNVDR